LSVLFFEPIVLFFIAKGTSLLLILPLSSTISSISSSSTFSGIFLKSVSAENSLAHFDHFLPFLPPSPA